MIKKFTLFAAVLVFSLCVLAWCGITSADSSAGEDVSQNKDSAELPFDYESLINDTSANAMLFNVMVVSEHTPVSIFGYGTKEMSGGSGVIYRKDGGRYYALTNDHVVSTDKDASYRSEYFIYDAFGNKYTAQLVARDESCDLAILTFKGSAEVELGTVKLASENPTEETKIISLGNPGGKFNSISLGEVLGMREVEPENGEDKIYFPVLIHSAPLDHGSSGGALLNYNFELVGVNYAKGNSEGAEREFGLAIPIEKVMEFLQIADSGFEKNTEESVQ